MDYRKWDGGRWTVDGGRWTVDGERWTVDGGRWTVDGGDGGEGESVLLSCFILFLYAFIIYTRIQVSCINVRSCCTQMYILTLTDLQCVIIH